MEAAKRVLVTGANGHVGNNLVRALLDAGHRVRASVRNTGDKAKTGMLPIGDIELVSLDVRDQRRFVEVAEGIDILFHVAATYKNYTASRTEADGMVRDAVDGASAAVLAAAKNRVPRLVLTSSVVTVPMVRAGGPATTEADWRTDFASPYHRAKTLAEREAWRLAREHGVDMVAVLPGAIVGPGFTRGTASTDVIESIMLGGLKMGAPDSNFPAVDIRDVISGHLLAADSGAGGRFIICNDMLPSFLELTRAMHAIDPAIPVAPRLLPPAVFPLAPLFDWINHKTLGAPRTLDREFVAAVRGRFWTMSNARAQRELGWRQRITLEQSLADTMSTLRQLRDARAVAPEATKANA